ncbi:MAG: anthranilate synthase component I [Alphaproteobacteria bacterium]|jgi:anthranilate synthase component 1
MKTQPSREAFAAGYDGEKPRLVWTELVADLETPVSAMLKLARGKRYSFLLESVEGGAVRGRYSVIGLEPDLIWRCTGNASKINRQALDDENAFVPCAEGSLDALTALIEESRIDVPEELPPMAAGLVGYMAYDMVRLMEKLPDDNPDVLGVPDAVFMRPTVTAIFDNVGDRITLITPIWPSAQPADEAYDAAAGRLSAVIKGLDRSLRHGGIDETSAIDTPPAPVSNMTPEAFRDMVRRAVEYIKAGDAFQIVPSQRFRVPLTVSPMALYRSLRRLNPSPFLFHLQLGDFTIVGSSPEILVRVRDGDVTIRPLAGTRPRGATPAEDKALEEELLADPKERAEHLMLLDLGRNDVGRVSEVGTVSVTESFAIERYSHVMHIVSNVEGRLKKTMTALQALVAGFPAGTVSGAPKVRAMEIIDELEPERRSFYAGSVGYFGANGDMDTCIMLRTALVKDGMMYVQAGGGVVADSDPEAEYQESCNKARALLRAAEDAARFADFEA